MKKILFRAALVLALCAVLLLTLPSCGKDEETEKGGISYDEERLSEYVAPFSYTGLTVELSSADDLKSDAVWNLILSRVEILSYPEDAVDYYAEQRRDTYRYYAEKNDWSYEQALEFFGVSEEDITKEAKEMVKGDLVYRYIVKDAGITLSEKEKSEQLDRYAKKYAEDYGYTEEYVIENMSDLIYDSMLYDKTMEYLIVNNTFIQK
jgi:FKBP-type peptidyl-prolyl cis-trans isomerase (trigger factor)